MIEKTQVRQPENGEKIMHTNNNTMERHKDDIAMTIRLQGSKSKKMGP